MLELLSPIYGELGGDPSELVMVKPWYGGWLNALRFSVVRADNSTTWVSRVDIDANNPSPAEIAAIRRLLAID